MKPIPRWRRASRSIALTTACVAGVLGLAADTRAAEPRVLRVVGVQPLDSSAARAGGPRQGAINAALFEAVSRVAHELVDEYGPPVADADGSDGGSAAQAELPDGWLQKALGKDMTPFARSFRLVEDKGSRPVLFPGETQATREYVVVIEATVDVDKVRGRLAEQGIIGVEEEVVSGDGVEIEALGLRYWSGYEAFVGLLEGPGVRASEVHPLEFEPGRALVFAVVRGSPEDVLARILSSASGDLDVTGTIVDLDPDGTAPRIRLDVAWKAPSTP